MGEGRMLTAWRPVALGALVVGVLVGCGQSGSSPGTPSLIATPTPGPSPSPTTTSFLHVRQEGGDIATYQVDLTTGRLRLAGQQRLGDVRALAGDPNGRFVYAAFNPNTLSVSHPDDASMALYEADEQGRLVALSELSERPWELGYGYSCGNYGWTWLAASADRVWGIWLSRFGGGCQHEAYTAVSHAVTAGGQFAPESSSDSWIDSGWAAIDPGTHLLYKSRWGFLYYGPAPLTAHAVGPAGRLVITGYSNLCFGSEVFYPIQPLVAVRGYVFGRADVGSEETVCSWEGPRLAPRAALGFSASHAAVFSPAAATAAALLAMAGDIHTRNYSYLRTDLRVVSMRSDGSVAVEDTVELQSRVLQLLFHPSGRFLYLADEDGRLRSYSVSPSGRIELIESLPDAARPAVGETWPYYDAQPPFMVVSVRKRIPRL